MFPKIDLKETGENIKRLIVQSGNTIKGVAEYMGFSTPTAVYKWVNGLSLPTVDNLVALSELLNVTVEEILKIKNGKGES